MTIRRARPGDVDTIRAIIVAAHSPYIERLGMRPAAMSADLAPV
jgi:hypothetical protein